MENVKGFDEGEARKFLVDMLKSQNYFFQVWLINNFINTYSIHTKLDLNFKEFLLSPIQFGIPNSRLRYFLIARLNEPFNFETQPEISNNKVLKFEYLFLKQHAIYQIYSN